METATILFFSATASFMFLCVGIVAGWTVKDFVHDYFYSRDEVQAMHPEMYDDDGIIINCLLYTSPSPRDSRKSRMPSSA